MFSYETRLLPAAAGGALCRNPLPVGRGFFHSVWRVSAKIQKKREIPMEKSVRNSHWGAGSPALRLTESAVMLAFAFVLCLFPIASLPYDGSITACSMLPVILIAYRYGWKWGLLTGFVFSLLQIVEGGIGTLSAFTQSPGSFLLVFFLDYVIAFTVLGLAGLFRDRIAKNQQAELVAGTLLVCLLRYACHFLSGITVWRDISIPMAGAVPFSLIYNATYMLPETIVTALGAFFLGGVLDFRREMVSRAPRQEKQPLSAVVLSVTAAVLFLAGLVFDTAHIFSHLQNPDTGVFDITGIAGCNWPLVIGVTAGALVLSGAALIVRKTLLAKQKLPLRRQPEKN